MDIENYIIEIKKKYNQLSNEEVLNFLNKKIFYIESIKTIPVFGNPMLKSYSETIIIMKNKTYRECIDFIKSQVTDEEWNNEDKMLKDKKNDYYSTMAKSFWVKFKDVI